MEPLNESNQSGNCKLRLLNIKDVRDMPTVSRDHRITTAITLQPSAAGWVDIPIVESTTNMLQQAVDYKGTEVYKITVPFEIAKETYDRLTAIIGLTKLRFIAEVTDNNGKLRLIGNDQEGLRLKLLNATTHDRPRLRNGYTLQLSITLRKPVPFLEL